MMTVKVMRMTSMRDPSMVTRARRRKTISCWEATNAHMTQQTKDFPALMATWMRKELIKWMKKELNLWHTIMQVRRSMMVVIVASTMLVWRATRRLRAKEMKSWTRKS
jgi:hypothetical protein